MGSKPKGISNRVVLLALAGVLALSALVGGLLWKSRSGGTQVVVLVNGAQWGSFDLRKNCTVQISPGDGSWYNILKIQDGKASIVESDCSTQICVHTPALSEDTVGFIVCLPHGLILELSGGE